MAYTHMDTCMHVQLKIVLYIYTISCGSLLLCTMSYQKDKMYQPNFQATYIKYSLYVPIHKIQTSSQSI